MVCSDIVTDSVGYDVLGIFFSRFLVDAANHALVDAMVC